MNFSENKPVIFIGLFTLVAFIVIIYLAGKNEVKVNEVVKVDPSIFVTSQTHIKGEASASATLVEFSDFQCPACGAFYPLLKQLEQKFGDKLRVIYKHYPLPQHTFARKAAEASEVASAQGKFWEYHDVLFENQSNLTVEDLKKYASNLGLNTEQFNSELDSGKYSQIVQDDVALGNKLNVQATPTFYLNGRKLVLKGGGDLEIEISKEIDATK